MIEIGRICDECGNPAEVHLFLETGRVLVDGKDTGQDVDLCEEHLPKECKWQPNSCKRIKFIYGGKEILE